MNREVVRALAKSRPYLDDIGELIRRLETRKADDNEARDEEKKV